MGSDRKGGVRGPDDDTRSCASEYDYGSKKKFTDVLGNTNLRNKRRLDEQYLKGQDEAFSQRSRTTQGSISVRSQTMKEHLR